MSVEKSFEPRETYIFEEIDVTHYHNGGPMWPTIHAERFTPEQLINESVHDDEATKPLPDTLPSNSFLYQTGSQGSDSDLNNITPSLVTSIMFPQTNKTGPPARGPYKGPYDFAVMINGAYTHKKKFMWSTKLQRMYVDAECDFPLSFSWSPGAPHPAFVRSMVVFRDPDQSQHRVETCVNHKSSLMKKNLSECQLSNVLHSSRESGATGVMYCGGPDEWYSTVVRFDDSVRTHAYRFVCKNSCTGGINRRATSIIFTLEDGMGTVFGREEVSVRVCACPRRDMRTEEGNAPPAKKPRTEPRPLETKTKKVKIEVTETDDNKIVVLPQGKSLTETRSAETKTKKVKIEVTDTVGDEIVVLPVLRVRGVSTAITTLEMIKEFTAQHKRLSTDTQVLEEDTSIISDLDTIINELKSNK